MAKADNLVVDASPLILLAQVEALHLLVSEPGEIIVPVAVAREVRGRSLDPAARALEDRGWYELVEAPAAPRELVSFALGAGETEVLAWAQAHPRSIAVSDDQRARQVATELEIPVFGTLGVVLRAKRRGEIPSARPVIERLDEAGMYLSRSLISQVLALVGE